MLLDTDRCLCLFRDKQSFIEERIAAGELPRFLGYGKYRHYHPVVVLELEFRATGGAGKGLRGRAEVLAHRGLCDAIGQGRPARKREWLIEGGALHDDVLPLDVTFVIVQQPWEQREQVNERTPFSL